MAQTKDSDGDFDASDAMLDRANYRPPGSVRLGIITPQLSHINGKVGEAASNPDFTPEIPPFQKD